MSTVIVETHKPGPPPVLHAAAKRWLWAVGLGAFEAVLMLSRDLFDGATAEDLIPDVGFRLAVYAGAIFLALRLKRGRKWARSVLACTLGVVGTLSLVTEPVLWLVDGGSLADAAAGTDAVGLLMVASRVLHLAAVFAAMVLMFHPKANAYFAAGPSVPRPRTGDAETSRTTALTSDVA